MSIIDNKIVKMVFDNAGFESGVMNTMGLLDKLQTKLNFSGVTNGLSEVGNAAEKISFNDLSYGIDEVSDGFSALETIAIGALLNIGMQAVNTGERLVKSLTVDQLTAGWTKYSNKTRSVQTIMAATAQDFEDQGVQMEYVNEQLDKLNWYTDETSYNFVDMVGNIGKFTSTGQSLDTSVTAMQGIANWAGISGATVGEASRAMYNLAQALSAGAVKLIDWKSIELANMGTKEFKETAISTAVAVGTLTKAGDGLYKTLAGHTVSVENFNNALSDGWFTSKVLMESLNKYGGATDKLYEISEAYDVTATDILTWVEANKKGELSFEDLKESLGDDATIETINGLREGINLLSSEEHEFGIKAFKAAQEAKTLQDAIDATADASSTAWMNIYETIFGDYDTARKVWTGFANWLYDTLVSPLESVQDVLDEWIGIEGARDRFLDIFRNISDVMSSMVRPIKDAWNTVFEPLKGEQIDSVIKNINNFLEKLKLSDETANKLKSIFTKLFEILKNIGSSIKSIVTALSPLLGLVKPLLNLVIDSLVKITSYISNVIDKIKNAISETNLLNIVFEKLSQIIDAIKLMEFSKHIELIFNEFKRLTSYISPAIDSIKIFVSSLSEVIGISSLFNNALDKIKSVLIKVGDAVKNIFGYIKDNIGRLTLTSLGINVIIKVLNGAVKGGPITNIIKLLKNFVEVLSSIFQHKKTEKIADKFLKLAGALALFAAAALILSTINGNDIMKSLLAMASGLVIMAGAISAIGLMGKMLRPATMTSFASSMLMLAGAMLILAAALGAFSLIAKMNSAWTGLAMLAVTLTTASVAIGVLSKVCSAGKMLVVSASILVVSAALVILAAALGAFALVAKMNSAWTGLAMLAVTLTAVSVAIGILSEVCSAGKMLVVSASILVVSAALVILAAALGAFALIAKMNSAWTGLAMLAVTLTAVSVAIGILSEVCSAGKMLVASASILVVSAALVIMGVAIMEIAAALALLSTCDPKNLALAMLDLVVMLAAVTGALMVLGTVGPILLVGAAALLVAAAAILVLASAVAVVNITLPMFATGLSLLGTAIGDIGAGIGRAVEGLISSFGRGIEQFAASIYRASAFISTSIALMGKNIESGLDSIGEGIGLLFENIGEGIANGLEYISSSIDKISESITGLGGSISGFGVGIKTLEDISWISLALGVSKLSSSLKELISNKFDSGNTNELIRFTTALSNLTNVVNYFGAAVSSMAGNMQTIGYNMVMYLVNGIYTASNSVIIAGYYVGSSAINAIDYYSDSFTIIGYNMMMGLANGIYSGSNSVASACYGVVSNAISVAQRTAKIHSPSRVMAELGQLMDAGLSMGIEQGVNDVGGSMFDVMSNAIAIARLTSEAISAAMENDITPTISPVLDLTDALNSANALSASMVLGTSDTIARKIQQDRSAFQNEDAVQKVVARLDESAEALLKTQASRDIQVNNVISFEGSLSQLARLLQPAITSETNRLGTSIVPT